MRGATSYHHIAFIGQLSDKSKADTSLYRTDNYTFPSLVNGVASSLVYVATAQSLVTIQMSLFSNGKKVLEAFYISAQFDRGYSFI